MFGLVTIVAALITATRKIGFKVGTVAYGPAQPLGPNLPAGYASDTLMLAARSILALIAQHESGGNYNIVFGNKTYPLTSMTIRAVYELQDQMVRENKVSSAVGKYQFIKKTLTALVSQLGLNANVQKLDPATQDRMALQLLINRGFEKFLRGQISRETFVKALSMEWASMPKDQSNKTYYDDGINRALTTYSTVVAALERSKQNYGVA